MIRIFAYAKLNLSLKIIGRRGDGFHQIDSIIQKIDLADEITVRPTGSSLVVENDLDIAPKEDLAWLAARLLMDEKRLQRGFRIRVHKSIPTGAGLGGGSSDAAAVLWATNLLTPPVISFRGLLKLAQSLGSDVPLFFWGGLVRVEGRGEKVAPEFPSRRESFVIVVPPIHCDTGHVYKQLRLRGFGPATEARKMEFGDNDLYGAALQLHPQLRYYEQAINSVGGLYAGISGSGSAFYVAFSYRDNAAAARDRLARELPKARVFLCQGISVGFEAIGE